MMIYRGFHGVQTVSGALFVPRLKHASVFPSVSAAMGAIDSAINQGRVAPSQISAGPGAVKPGRRTGETREVGETGPARRAVGIVQDHPERGEAERPAPGAKEGKRKERSVGQNVLDATLVAAISFLVVFVCIIAAGTIQP